MAAGWRPGDVRGTGFSVFSSIKQANPVVGEVERRFYLKLGDLEVYSNRVLTSETNRDSKINCSAAVTVLLVQIDLGRCEQKRGDV